MHGAEPRVANFPGLSVSVVVVHRLVAGELGTDEGIADFLDSSLGEVGFDVCPEGAVVAG